jgi:hypothetical protein
MKMSGTPGALGADFRKISPELYFKIYWGGDVGSSGYDPHVSWGADFRKISSEPVAKRKIE